MGPGNETSEAGGGLGMRLVGPGNEASGGLGMRLVGPGNEASGAWE